MEVAGAHVLVRSVDEALAILSAARVSSEIDRSDHHDYQEGRGAGSGSGVAIWRVWAVHDIILLSNAFHCRRLGYEQS